MPNFKCLSVCVVSDGCLEPRTDTCSWTRWVASELLWRSLRVCPCSVGAVVVSCVPGSSGRWVRLVGWDTWARGVEAPWEKCLMVGRENVSWVAVANGVFCGVLNMFSRGVRSACPLCAGFWCWGRSWPAAAKVLLLDLDAASWAVWGGWWDTWSHSGGAWLVYGWDIVEPTLVWANCRDAGEFTW